ncbi:acyl-CoA dehydratase activase [Desulfospira joergensenii]|uniref:acyl-CoA dehydratase activase n=1 Tax=Desulfospira joergensenii TaxID=53329 RepID=UPI0003B71DA3|nr:acyl-CoA dehydratase activase [Desulfospira joergensenii]
MIFAGIDIGSITAKAALIKDNRVVATRVIPTGYNHSAAGEKVFQQILRDSGIDRKEIQAVVATGYGRASVEFADKAMTEIICHGAGAYFLDPGVRGIIDVGGQDSKAILLDGEGHVQDFAMNDKCAAGTGRFLEVMAQALEVPLKELGELSLTGKEPVKISSVCTVFAESEVISMIARQKKRENIISGIHASAAARIASLVSRAGIRPPVVMTGGVARNQGMVKALEDRLGWDIAINPFPQENGAIGAAVLASRL